MVENPLRIPPQHIDSELALLGAIMIRPEAIHEIVDTISSDAFYSEKHRIIFRAMMALFGKSEPIDLLSLSSKLKDGGELERIGGSSYLS